MKKRWKNAGLYALLAIVVIALGTALLDQRGTETVATWRYSEFVQRVENKQVAKVILSPDRSSALVQAEDGDKVQVNLPNDPQLLKILTDNNVDISVRPQNQDSVWLRALSSLFFPILLRL